MQKKGEGQTQNQFEGYGRQHEQDGKAERLPEPGIGRQRLVISKPDEGPRQECDLPVQAVDARPDNGYENERQEDSDERRDKGVPPKQVTERSVLSHASLYRYRVTTACISLPAAESASSGVLVPARAALR